MEQCWSFFSTFSSLAQSPSSHTHTHVDKIFPKKISAAAAVGWQSVLLYGSVQCGTSLVIALAQCGCWSLLFISFLLYITYHIFLVPSSNQKRCCCWCLVFSWWHLKKGKPPHFWCIYPMLWSGKCDIIMCIFKFLVWDGAYMQWLHIHLVQYLYILPYCLPQIMPTCLV